MTTITLKRRTGAGILIAAALALVGACVVSNITIHRTNVFTGWVMLVTLFALAMLNVCKKLSPLPLGRVTTWLQFHVYLGILSVVVFALHTGLHTPNGGLEGTLGTLYVLVAGTGFIGLALSRTLPQRLSRRGEEVLFERIPVFRKRLEEQADALVLRSVAEGNSTVIAEFHTRRLSHFLAGTRHFWSHLLGSNRTSHALLTDLRALDRYLNERERALRASLEEILRKKDDLDFHYACGAALKYWLFIHIPLTYSLLAVALLHAVVVYAFSGGLR